jgi:hypothetical protein
MVFHLFLKLRELRYDFYPHAQASSVSEAYTETRHDHLTVGIGCGPSGNNCSVEGHGDRGPGPIPLPGEVRAKFRGGHFRHRGSRGSLFDLTAAQKTLHVSGADISRSSGGSGGSSSSGTPHSHVLGFGPSAYSTAHVQSMYTSGVNTAPAIASSGSRNDAQHGSFFGRLTNPKPTRNVSEAWGRDNNMFSGNSAASQHGGAAQFGAVASMVPQSSGSSFHMKYSHGVVDPTSVEVRGGGGGGGGGTVGVGRWSWNSAKLMDKDYNLLVKPTSVDVSRSWGKSVRDGQFSSASMLPQSSHSSFNFGIRHGVVDMSSVYASSDRSDRSSARHHSANAVVASAGGRSYYNDGLYAVGLGAKSGAGVAGSGQGSSGALASNGYSWSTGRNGVGGSSGMGDWLIAPEAAQWLPEGIGTDI